MVTPSLPFLANPGRWEATGSSHWQRPRSQWLNMVLLRRFVRLPVGRSTKVGRRKRQRRPSHRQCRQVRPCRPAGRRTGIHLWMETLFLTLTILTTRRVTRVSRESSPAKHGTLARRRSLLRPFMPRGHGL